MNANPDQRTRRRPYRSAAREFGRNPARCRRCERRPLVMRWSRRASVAGTAGAVGRRQNPLAARRAAAASDAEADAATYERCMKLAKNDPAAAPRAGRKVARRGGAHPADHCFAVALIGLKQYKDGADRLDKLAQAMMTARRRAARRGARPGGAGLAARRRSGRAPNRRTARRWRCARTTPIC